MAVSMLAAPSLAAKREAAVIVLQRPSDPPVPEAAAGAIERAIDATDALSVVGADTMAQRLRRDFQDAAALERGVAEGLEREAAELLDAVAFGRDRETVARGRALIRRESLRLPATNRSERASRALGNLCLFVVRALLHDSNDSGARAQARECLQLIPDLAPSADEHPPDVRTVVAAARSDALGKLVVVPIAPAPQGCSLLIQGREVGRLPLQIEVVPGAYQLQTDCGAPGLLRQVTAQAGKIERVTVVPRLERALRLTRPSLLFSGTGADALRSEDLAHLADWLAIAEIWAIDRTGAALRVTRWLRTSRGLVAQEEILTPVDPAETLASRIDAAVAPVACRVAGCTAGDRGPRSPAPRVAGTIAAGVGLAAMLGAWAAWARTAALDGEIERGTAQPGFDDTRIDDLDDDRESASTIAVVSTSAGSALFAASMPFVLPERRGVPWWAWSAGVVGTAAAAVGTRLWIDHGERETIACPSGFARGCTRPQSALPLAPMLVTQGASLLSVPLTYVVRDWTATEAGSVGFNASPHAFGITWTQSTRAF